jgi:hypothetical protein
VIYESFAFLVLAGKRPGSIPGSTAIKIFKNMEKSVCGMDFPKQRIYISGKITGLDKEVAAYKFRRAEQELSFEDNVEIINPLVKAEIILRDRGNESPTWDDYMEVCFELLKDCDCIYMLRNYKDSQGALLEFEYAKNNNIKVIYE